MASETRPTKLRVDDDGVRTIETTGVRAGIWLLAVAMVLVGLLLLLVVRPFLRRGETETTSSPAAGAPPAVATAKRAAAAPAPARTALRLAPIDAAKQLPPPPAAEQNAANPPAAVVEAQPVEGEADTAEGEGDEPSGIALFPPPGTDPPKIGIVVPEEFELPPGYIRHYQVTDGGTRLPAILMFHPDFQLVDDHGEPVPMPADRVVPPEMAPPGLAIQILEVPDDPAEGHADPGAQDPSP